MSKEKNVNVEETIDMIKNDEKSSWDGSEWMIPILMMLFGGLGFNHDTTDHEIRERVARLEGQMDMIRR